MESNSIPRTERYSLTLRQLVQCGCQKTLMGGDIGKTSRRVETHTKHLSHGPTCSVSPHHFAACRLLAQAPNCQGRVEAGPETARSSSPLRSDALVHPTVQARHSRAPTSGGARALLAASPSHGRDGSTKAAAIGLSRYGTNLSDSGKRQTAVHRGRRN
jgi:hypothetical protein